MQGSPNDGRAQGGAGVDPTLLQFIESNSMLIEGQTSDMPAIKEEAVLEQPRQAISKSLKDWIDEGVNFEAMTTGRLLYQSEKFTAMYQLLAMAESPVERIGWLNMLKNGVEGISERECEYLQEIFGNFQMDEPPMEGGGAAAFSPSIKPGKAAEVTETVEKVEDERAKTIAALKQEYFRARDEVKKLYGPLGYGNGNGYYNMLPLDAISKEQYEASKLQYEERLKKAEVDYSSFKREITTGPSFSQCRFPPGIRTPEQWAMQIKNQELNAKTTLNNIKSEYLGFLQTRAPIDSDAFFAKLHPLLDIMTTTLEALRNFQVQGVDIGDFKAI